MNTNNAAYLLALGVLAFGLHSQYQEGRFAPVHQVVAQVGSASLRMATHVEEALAATGLADHRHSGFAGDDSFASADAIDQAQAVLEQSAWLRVQAGQKAEMARDQIQARADEVRAQVECKRAKLEQNRWRLISEAKIISKANRATLFCESMRASSVE